MDQKSKGTGPPLEFSKFLFFRGLFQNCGGLPHRLIRRHVLLVHLADLFKSILPQLEWWSLIQAFSRCSILHCVESKFSLRFLIPLIKFELLLSWGFVIGILFKVMHAPQIQYLICSPDSRYLSIGWILVLYQLLLLIQLFGYQFHLLENLFFVTLLLCKFLDEQCFLFGILLENCIEVPL